MHFPSHSLFLSSFIPSAQFSCSVVSDSLRPHEWQHTRPPCPLQTPGVHSDSCPLSWWCPPTISPSVAPFSSCPQSFPASGSFSVSWLFASSDQSIGDSASASVLPINIHEASLREKESQVLIFEMVPMLCVLLWGTLYIFFFLIPHLVSLSESWEIYWMHCEMTLGRILLDKEFYLKFLFLLAVG